MRLEFIKTHTVLYQLPYPEEFDLVLRGEAYWYPHPINIIDYQNKFVDLNTFIVYDLNHPRCPYCGKFVKKGDWWRSYQTSPCNDCSESTIVW